MKRAVSLLCAMLLVLSSAVAMAELVLPEPTVMKSSLLLSVDVEGEKPEGLCETDGIRGTAAGAMLFDYFIDSDQLMDFTFQPKYTFVGYHESSLYMISQVTEASVVVVVELDFETETAMYYTFADAKPEDNEELIQQFCPENYWQPSQEAILSFFENLQ